MSLTLDDFARVYAERARAKSAHLIPGESRHDPHVMALCGRRYRDGADWLGSGSPMEMRKAQRMPTCRDCLVIAENLIADVPQQRVPVEDFTEPNWCRHCGRKRICEGEFEWLTELDGWRHKWQFCAEDLRYERCSPGTPAVAL